MEKKQVAKLVNRARKGNKEAFAEIYSYFAQNIYYFALRITQNDHDANDVVQDTMFALYQNLSNLKDSNAVTSFVKKTAYNFSIMLIRKRRDFLTSDDSLFESEFEEDEEFIPESYLEEKEKREEIIKILDNLPEAQRIVLMMFYFEGLSSKEIAKILETSDEAVRGRLFRGRESMKNAITLQGMKGVALASMSIPVLSKILELESKAAFSPTVHALNWEHLASRINLTPGEVAATVAKATVNNAPAVVPAIGVASTVAPMTLGGSAISTKGIIATIIAITVVGTSIAVVNQPILAEGIGQKNDSKIQNIENIEGYNSLDGQNKNSAEISSKTDIQQNNPENVKENKLSESEKLENSSMIKIDTLIKRENDNPLKYPIGSQVSPEDIIRDSEISVSDGINLENQRFDLLDTSKKGEYIVYFIASRDDVYEKLAIIISIE